MAHTIQTTNCLTAWRDVCNYISNNGEGFNLLVEIEEPLNYTQIQLNEIYSTGLITNANLSNVINTIFPYKLNKRNHRLTNSQFYELYAQVYLRGKTKNARNRSTWGTYFLRFTQFGINESNQLQNIIDTINQSVTNNVARYIVHTSSIDTDNNTRRMGAPCLQYIQFGISNGEIHMTAIYRNHDFYNKALGNYIGLARLLEFVSAQTNFNMGTLTCHSIHYYLPSKRLVNQIIQSLTW